MPVSIAGIRPSEKAPARPVRQAGHFDEPVGPTPPMSIPAGREGVFPSPCLIRVSVDADVAERKTKVG